ncbi:hypothetical protein OsJ_04353 [Oryza sativa Japonica Group]|uniref:C2H2-type domain-containing protein n=1 Tax=Oryza sativa subsp. japonica TaxID=39947 RepID=B9EV96_ORYSJ|nr:hypothetical protein OsJ_04353 [Oryza sativa Japonica Group]
MVEDQEKSSSSPPVPPPPEEEEMEEGEIHPGGGGGGGYYDSGSETEDDDDRYVFQSRRDDEEEEEGVNPASKRRRLEDILAETRGALPLPSPTPSSSGSEGTISDDHGDGIAGAAAAADAPVARVAFPCHVCSKEFGSRKAVHGHMRVHQADKDKEKEPSLHLALGWTSTGKPRRQRQRPFCHRRLGPHGTSLWRTRPGRHGPSCLEPAGQAQPQPMVVAEAANPPNPVADDNHRLPVPAAVPYVGAAAAPARRRARPKRNAGQGGPYRCSYPGCKGEYRTHQGLGGHVAGHINREKQAAAAAQGGSGARPEGNHPCKTCGKEFSTGVALGGHMRKHYDPKKKKKHAGLVLTLSVAPPTPAPAPSIAGAALPPAEVKADVDEHEAEQVPMAPVSPPAEARGNIVRIFGVDIEKPADEEEQEGGSDV